MRTSDLAAFTEADESKERPGQVLCAAVNIINEGGELMVERPALQPLCMREQERELFRLDRLEI